MWLPSTTTAAVAVEGRSVDPPQAPPPSDASSAPQPSQAPASPSIVRTGEIMLIFSLLLIFMVACFVALHFYLRSRRRKARKAKLAKERRRKRQEQKPVVSDASNVSNETEIQDDDDDNNKDELPEMEGTPLCELGESEPRHEMEDIEVPETVTQEPIGSAISTAGPVAIPAAVYIPGPEPDVREHAVYWSARM